MFRIVRSSYLKGLYNQIDRNARSALKELRINEDLRGEIKNKDAMIKSLELSIENHQEARAQDAQVIVDLKAELDENFKDISVLKSQIADHKETIAERMSICTNILGELRALKTFVSHRTYPLDEKNRFQKWDTFFAKVEANKNVSASDHLIARILKK